MKRCLKLCLILIVLNKVVSVPGVWASDSGGVVKRPLKIAAVQFKVQETRFRSVQAFKSAVSGLVEKSMDHDPDLIVFPEYTAAFIALIPYRASVGQAENVYQGFELIREREPLVRDLRDLFLLNSGFVERVIEETFGALAARHSVWILGGTYFARVGAGNGDLELRNRAFLYDREGKPAYSQDKAFLTDFESSILKLSPGKTESAGKISIEGYRVGLTICRDTYEETWERSFSGRDLWIDIKANGVRYGEEEEESFLRALPARIGSGEVPFGITVCLTGSFLDLFWEGESSFIKKDGREARFLKRAKTPREEEILFFLVAPFKNDTR